MRPLLFPSKTARRDAPKTLQHNCFSFDKPGCLHFYASPKVRYGQRDDHLLPLVDRLLVCFYLFVRHEWYFPCFVTFLLRGLYRSPAFPVRGQNNQQFLRHSFSLLCFAYPFSKDSSNIVPQKKPGPSLPSRWEGHQRTALA